MKKNDLPLECDTWLASHGFVPNPFPSNATRAETDKVLQNDETAFVRVPNYGSIRGTLDDPGAHFIFAESGGGKTTVREEIKRYYDGLLGMKNNPQVLSVIYKNFEDLPTGDLNEDDYQQILYRAHVERIIAAILLRLFDVWGDKRQSACIRGIKHKRIKKQLQWYLTKFLNLFPWQFKKLQKSARMRSYLPLLHYLIRVLLGALSSLVPATGPLATALGDIPTYKNYSKLEGKFIAVELLSELISLCKEIGYSGVYVLIDNLELGYSEEKKYEKGFYRIAPLFWNLDIYDISGMIIKIFIPQGMEPFYKQKVRQTRILPVKMEWTRDLIRDVYKRRLRSCWKVGEDAAEPSLEVLCDLSLRDKIDQFMIEYGCSKKTPQALIEIGVRLLDEHFYTTERFSDELISLEAWERATYKAMGSKGEEVL